MDARVAFHEEVQLAGWGESHTSGAKVTFWLQDPEQLAMFRGLTERKGKCAGHRFYMTLVEIGDDEQPKPPELAEDLPLLGPLALLAVRWCRDPKFLAWAGHNWPHTDDPECRPLTQEEARALILDVCKVGSRKDLDTVPTAAAIFHREFRHPYMNHTGGDE